MSFRNWSEDDYAQFQKDAYERIFDEIPSVADLSEDDIITAEELFAAGWLTWGVYDQNQLEDIRDQFYDLMSMYPDDFDWEEFRESYDEING
jgi:hypothetical protein